MCAIIDKIFQAAAYPFEVVAENSLYPEKPRKSAVRRWCEAAFLLIRDGARCHEYNAAGLDLVGHSIFDYITEAFRRKKIEPKAETTPISYTNLLNDKYLFALYFGSHGIPVVPTLADSVRGRWNADPVQSLVEAGGVGIVKRVNGWCGRNVFKVKIVDGRLPRMNFDLYDTEANYIVQPVLANHPVLQKLNGSSLNTLRIMTYLDPADRKAKLWDNGFLRIGGLNADVDNFWAGGVAIPFLGNGCLSRNGFTLSGKGKSMKIIEESATGLRFEGYEIPYYSEACELCLKAHELVPTIPSIGWDVAITQQGPVLIEGNHDWGNDIVQVVKCQGDMAIYKKVYLGK